MTVDFYVGDEIQIEINLRVNIKLRRKVRYAIDCTLRERV